MKKKLLAALTLAAILTLTACSQENLPYEIPVADIITTSQEEFSQTKEDASESSPTEAPEETSKTVAAPDSTTLKATETVTDTEPITETEPVTETKPATETESVTESVTEAEPVTETEPPVTTPTVTNEAETPKWTETNISATVMYINQKNVYSRIDAIQGSTKVEALGYNQAVTVIAKTDTGYFKTDRGDYVHQSFLSSEKTVTTTPAVTTTTTVATATEPAPEIIGNYNQRAQTQAEIDFANKVFELTNAEREKAGAPALKKSDVVTQMANTRAWELTISPTHDRPDGSDFSTVLNGMDYLSIGENLAAGQVTPEEVVKAWMDSPHHKANILSPDFEYLGIGYYHVGGTTYKHFWIQTFYK